MTPLTEPQRKALREALEKATPGPWTAKLSLSTHKAGYPICDATCGVGLVPIRTEVGTKEQGCEGKELHVFESDIVEDIVAANGDHVVCFGHDYDDYGSVGRPDAAYIAAANPEVVRALLDERDALAEVLAKLREHTYRDGYVTYADVMSLEAQHGLRETS